MHIFQYLCVMCNKGLSFFHHLIKRIVHQFWIFNIFFIPLEKKHFLWKVHLDKTTLTQNNWEIRVLKVSLTEYCYIYYIARTDFEHNISQLFRVSVVLSRWTFHKKCFFCWGKKKMLYIQNWWTIPLMYLYLYHYMYNVCM